MLEIKPTIQAWKTLTRGHVFIEEELEFIKLSWHGRWY
jgi:hypothetical protein